MEDMEGAAARQAFGAGKIQLHMAWHMEVQSLMILKAGVLTGRDPDQPNDNQQHTCSTIASQVASTFVWYG